MSFGIIDIIISDLIDGIIPVTMENKNINGAQGGVPEEGRQAGLVDVHRADYVEEVDMKREEEMEAMREKIRQLESQLH